MSDLPYQVALPAKSTSACVFSVPHSGRNYTPEFIQESQLSLDHLRSSEDAYVDDLFETVSDCGAPLLVATVPRAYVDLNRGAEELDPALITGASAQRGNPRVAAGLGVIPRVVAKGREIRAGKISLTGAQERLDHAYHPYHARLRSMLDTAFARHRETLLIDCHSMPRSALANITVRGGKRPDIVIGDRFGSSCAPEIADQVERAFLRQDFIVARNLPFAGAYIMRQYGRPHDRRNAVQVEIDRSIYMDETSLKPRAQYNEIKHRIGLAVAELAAISQTPMSFAAE